MTLANTPHAQPGPRNSSDFATGQDVGWRVERVWAPHDITVGPDGEVTLSVNARGAETRFHFDRLGRLDETTNPLGGKVKKSFDEVGNLIRVEDEERHAWLFAYDLLGRRIRETDPNGGTTHYTFNALELVKVRHADGSEWQYNHDPASGRLTSRVLRDRTGAIEDIESFSYDVLGSRTRAENGAVKVTSTFDIMRREVKRTTLWKKTSAVRELAFSWDAMGRRQAMSDSHGRVTRYSYDKLSRPVKIAVNEPNPRSTSVADAYFKREYAFAWDPNSNLTQVEYPNGTRTRRVFDDIDRMTTLVHERVTGPSTAETLASWEIVRDPNGNPVKVTREGGEVWGFEHDALDRLVKAHLPRELVVRLRAKDPAKGNSKDEDGDRDEDDCAERLLAVSGSGDIEYKYTPAGNREEENIGGRAIRSTFDAANQMLTRGTMRFGYDPIGNQTEKIYKSGRREVFNYSAAGKLASYSTGHVKKPDKLKDVERYLYSPNNERVLVDEVQGGLLTHALWDGARPIEEWVTKGSSKGAKDKGTLFTRGLGGDLLDQARYMRKDGRTQHGLEDEDCDDWDDRAEWKRGGPEFKLGHVRFTHPDFLGSTALVTNHRGKTLDRLSYGPWGEPLEGNFKKAVFGYTGHQFEANTGHWAAKFRQFDPRAGRWTQRDPMEDIDGTNRYAYVQNGPFSSTDPFGLWSWLKVKRIVESTFQGQNALTLTGGIEPGRFSGADGPRGDTTADYAHCRIVLQIRSDLNDEQAANTYVHEAQHVRHDRAFALEAMSSGNWTLRARAFARDELDAYNVALDHFGNRLNDPVAGARDMQYSEMYRDRQENRPKWKAKVLKEQAAGFRKVYPKGHTYTPCPKTCKPGDLKVVPE